MSRSTALISVSDSISLNTTTSIPPAPSTAPTLVLLHFAGGSSRTYDSLISCLDGSHNIIAPTARGWGQSSKPPDPSAYRIEDGADDVVALLRHFQTHRPELVKHGVVLVGHSMGGKVAQYLLTRSQAGNLIKGTILLGPAPSSTFALSDEMRAQQLHAYSNADAAAFVVRNVLLAHPERLDTAVLDWLTQDLVSGSPEAASAWASYGIGAEFREAMVDVVRERLASEKCAKVLVVAGQRDLVETAENVETKVVKVLRDAGAEVTFEVLDEVGHLIPVEAPERLAEVIREFVAGL